MFSFDTVGAYTSCSSCYHHSTFGYIYNGNIFPSLNPAKIFQFISRWTESTKSSAVGPNHRAVINTSNEVKSPLLWEFWIYNFSLRILEKVLGWKHCKYMEWVSFFLGSRGMNRSAEQTNRPRTASRFTRFVCPALRFIPHEPRKKDTHSLNIRCRCRNKLGYLSRLACSTVKPRLQYQFSWWKFFDANFDSVNGQRKLELPPFFLKTLTDFDGNLPIKVLYSDNASHFYTFQQVKVEEKVKITYICIRYKVINQDWHNMNNIFTLVFSYYTSDKMKFWRKILTYLLDFMHFS